MLSNLIQEHSNAFTILRILESVKEFSYVCVSPSPIDNNVIVLIFSDQKEDFIFDEEVGFFRFQRGNSKIRRPLINLKFKDISLNIKDIKIGIFSSTIFKNLTYKKIECSELLELPVLKTYSNLDIFTDSFDRVIDFRLCDEATTKDHKDLKIKLIYKKENDFLENLYLLFYKNEFVGFLKLGDFYISNLNKFHEFETFLFINFRDKYEPSHDILLEQNDCILKTLGANIYNHTEQSIHCKIKDF